MAEEHYRHALDILEHREHTNPDGLTPEEKSLRLSSMLALALLLAISEEPGVLKPAEALLWAERSIKAGYPGVDVKAAALHALGRTEDAVEILEEALQRDQGPREIHEHQLKVFRKFLEEKKLGSEEKTAPP